jgi:magnesium transporter
MAAKWVDLCDPERSQLEAALPRDVHARALDQLRAPAVHDDEPRPTIEGHGDYIFAVFLVPVAVPADDTIYYQEIDIVATHEQVVTVRKTPAHGEPFDCSPVHEIHDGGKVESVGLVVYHIVDEVAEAYLNLTDALDAEIDELEDHVEDWSSEKVRDRISSLRHDLLHIRQTLAPTRDALRRVVDNRVELDGETELFNRDVELNFADAYDKMLRAAEALDLARDLVAGVRDYHQAKIANDQNEVMKRLTVIASLLLLPTFIVGLYGQNFRDIPELRWHLGYAYVWAVIVVTTALQLWWFRRNRWF